MNRLAPTSPWARTGDGVWRATAVAGAAQLAGLAIALTDSGHGTLAVWVAASGLVIAIFVLAPPAGAAVRRHPVLLLASALSVVFAVAFVGLGLFADSRIPRLPGIAFLGSVWGLGRAALLPLALMTLAVIGGLVLIADALRSRLGLARQETAPPWRRVTGTPPDARLGRVPWRAVAGVALITWAAFLGIGLAGPYVTNNGPLQLLLLLLILGSAAVVIGTPLLIASFTRTEREDATRVHENERQRFAAHLHDSVLQTLALIQRQSADPVAVARLARRQEHALRAWMAGEAELSSDTLSATLRDIVGAVEDEHDITVEHSIIGDRRLDPAGEALAAATREALRNAARHAAGGPVFVFAELSDAKAEVFVRDEGPGFELDDVPSERRGIRDAIVGRMAGVGGRANIESAPGEGTEVGLAIGPVG
jgi:signal transduction histidine kinase